MIDAWEARRAVWRKDWEQVRVFIAEIPLESRIKNAIEDDAELGPHRALLVLGVFTSFGLEYKSLQDVKNYWLLSVPYFKEKKHYDELRQYFEMSVVRFGIEKGILINPSDFGFRD